jgi:hypothetical protein
MKTLISKLNFKSSEQQIEAFLRQGEKDFNNSYKSAIKTDIANGHTMVGQTGPAAKELSKIEILRKIVNDKPTTPKEIDRIIKDIKVKNDAAYASSVAKIKTKTTTGPVTPPGPGKPPGPPPPIVRRKSKKLGAKHPSLVARIKAGMSWSTLLKVGAGIGSAIYENGYNNYVPYIGIVTGISSTVSPGIFSQYFGFGNSIPGVVNIGIGTGALFQVLITYNSSTGNPIGTSVQLIDGGSGYSVGQQISIAGTYMGGATPTNNLYFTIIYR